LGTNLYYYAIFEGAYSHVYSFFLFSAWIYALKEFEKTQEKKYWLNLFALATLVILVRQINAVFLLLSFLMLKNEIALARNKSAKDWLYGFGISALIFLPQIGYNIYLTGTPFFYSYQNEGFIYWHSPKIKEVILGFENGWLSTNPILILSLIGLAFLWKTHKKETISIGLILLSCTYLYASWWCYNLGCAYGHRGFVDIYPFLILPFAFFIDHILVQKNRVFNWLIYLFLIGTIAYNLKYIYTYDSCWPISFEQSDFEIFWHFLTSNTK